jgi:hypothetical protein
VKTAKQVDKLIDPKTFQGLAKLEPNEQDLVRREARALAHAMKGEAVSKLSIGEHLAALRKVLEPRRIFVAFLKQWSSEYALPMSRATAYRYIEQYNVAYSALPSNVLEMAVRKGTKIGTEALVSNPPPETQDQGEIEKYLDNLKTTRVEVVAGPDTLLRECVNFVGTRWDKLPAGDHKARTKFMGSLIGMLLAKFGVASEQSFAPMAIPDTFRAVRGRPRSVAA